MISEREMDGNAPGARDPETGALLRPTQGSTMTYGEKAVGLTFNPTGDPTVLAIKQLYAQIIDLCDALRTQAGKSEKAPHASIWTDRFLNSAHVCLFWASIGSMPTIGMGHRLKFCINATASFEGWERSAQCRTASHFDPEPMRGSPGGMTAATAAGRPITSGRSCSMRNTMPERYAMNCAASARAMPKSSTSKQSRAIPSLSVVPPMSRLGRVVLSWDLPRLPPEM